MRKGARKPSANEDDEFMFRRENVFDFDAWYRAHFQDDFEKKLRNERALKFARDYQQQMERIMRGEQIRPPRPYSQRPTLSDIEIQMDEMEKKELHKDVSLVVLFLAIFIVSFFLVVCIIEANTDKSPWVDPYVIKKEKELEEEKKKKL